MSAPKDQRKRTQEDSEMVDPAAKPEPKKSRSEYDPLDEAQPLGQRRSAPRFSSVPSSSGSSAAATDSDTLVPDADNVFPHEKTMADMSVGSQDDDLFELALQANPDEALSMAETESQKKRAWEAVKAKKAEVSFSSLSLFSQGRVNLGTQSPPVANFCVLCHTQTLWLQSLKHQAIFISIFALALTDFEVHCTRFFSTLDWFLLSAFQRGTCR